MPFDRVDRTPTDMVCKRPMPTNDEILLSLAMATHDLFCHAPGCWEPCGDPLCLTCRRNAKAHPSR